MRKHAVVPAIVAGVLSISGIVHAEGLSSVTTIFGHDPGAARASACFSRQYTKAHLAGHPHQNVTDMLVYVDKPAGEGEQQSYTVALGVNFRTLATAFQVSGSCSAGSDGRSALNCGIECDGGSISVRVKNEESILVEIPRGARIWDPESEAEPPANARFGSDDKLFRLDRANVEDCLSLVWDEDVKKAILSGK